MMDDTIEEPLRKRPRLSMFANQSSDNDQLDGDLGGRRIRNDLLLKSRFESIFEKYSHNFTGVGDEIDMDNLTVVVNNGHLQSMENETDPGGLHNIEGQSLLRAMTEAPDAEEEDHHNAGADEVMNSIEEIAEDVAAAEDQGEMDPMDSDEELFLPLHARACYITPPDSRESPNTVRSDLSNSEHGSFFETQQRESSGSPDSLFEVQRRPSARSSDTTNPLVDSAGLDEEVDDNAILQKFGPQVGREVLTILRRARDAADQAHIEPAWRIPTSISPPEQGGATSRSKTPSAAIMSPLEMQLTNSPEHTTSLWKPARHRSTKRAMHQALVKRRIRAESEDPLQTDCVNGKEQEESRPKDERGSDWEEEPRPYKRKAKADEQILQLRKGTCFYCHRQWSSRPSVFYHWDKLADEADKGEVDDNVHDLDYIRRYMADSTHPRLVVSDYKIMVELHEGAGLSFDEIAKCRALQTKKPGHALKKVYDRYRTVSDHLEDNPAPWTKKELQTLQELSEHPKTDMARLASHFENRSNTEIGDKVAEIWLGELIDSRQVSARATQQPKTTPSRRSTRIQVKDHKQREPLIDPLSIKEESDTDHKHFGRR